METVRYTLNDTVFELDKATGALAELSFPGVGPLQKMGGKGRAAGLVDIAWPVHYEYETLRANPCGGSHRRPPEIAYDGQSLILTYDQLPQTFDTPEIEDVLAGRLYARIELRAMADGRSVSMRCFVKNNSSAPVEQVVFPNFDALVPTDGKENTRITMMGGWINPYGFIAPRGLGGQFNSQDIRGTGLLLDSTGCQTGPLVGRWYDWGSFRGGFSLYHRRWGWNPGKPDRMGMGDRVLLRYSEYADRVRVATVDNTPIPAGGEYDSGEFVMTAHTGPWLFGCESYRDWVREHRKPAIPRPRRANEMLGFRSIHMSHYPMDPNEVDSAYEDIPAIAADLAEHGLADLWVEEGFDFTLPVTEDVFYKNWGGLPAWKENVRKAKKLGVNVVAFVSWVSLWGKTCDNYGIEKRSGSWATGRELIPARCAPYAKKWSCWQIWDQSDERWRRDILEGLRFMRDEADCPNIAWDQYVLGDNNDDILHEVINRYKQETIAKYPDAVWWAESTLYFESEIDNTDINFGGVNYEVSRWDWDLRPMMYIVGDYRSTIVGSSPRLLRKGLIDHQVLGVHLRYDEEKRHRALIADNPEYSADLKRMGSIYKRYFDFLVDGVVLGDCVLQRECQGAYVTSQRMDDRLLVWVLKNDDRDVELNFNLAPFLGSGSRRMTVRGEEGETLAEGEIAPDGACVISGPADRLRVIEIR